MASMDVPRRQLAGTQNGRSNVGSQFKFRGSVPFALYNILRLNIIAIRIHFIPLIIAKGFF